MKHELRFVIEVDYSVEIPSMSYEGCVTAEDVATFDSTIFKNDLGAIVNFLEVQDVFNLRVEVRNGKSEKSLES